MRKTLHEYNLQKLSDLDCTAISDVLHFTKLTNRAPKLGDFIACDEEGLPIRTTDPSKFNMLDPVARGYYEDACREHKAAKSRVIFKGEWEVGSTGNWFTEIKNKKLELRIRFEDDIVTVFKWRGISFEETRINYIEDLPREIEFKEGVI